jgi:hypothetical protein
MTISELEMIKKAILKQQGVWNTKNVQMVQKYLDGDHWQNGDGWSGPKPEITEASSGVVSKVMSEIERGFVSQNIIAECVSRHTDVCVVEPNFSMTLARELGTGEDGKPEQPTRNEQALIREASTALTNWFDSKEIMAIMQKAVSEAISTGRGVLRLYVPRAATVADETGATIVLRGTLDQTIQSVYLSSPAPTSAGVLKDVDGNSNRAYFKFLDPVDETSERLEAQALEGTDTVVSLETNSSILEVRYPLAGVLLSYELQRPAIVSPQIVSLQKLINKTHTMLSRNTDVGGFIERTIENGQLPTVTKIDENGQEVQIPIPLKVGAGTVNFIAPYIYENEIGQKTAIPARMNYRDPVPIDTFEGTLRVTERAVYKEFKQLHITMSGDGNASGTSRIQAMNDFRTSVKPTVTMLEKAYRWLFGTALRLAAHFEGNADRFNELRVTVTVTPELSILTAEEIQVIIEMFTAGLISRASAIEKIRLIHDAEAERLRMRIEAREDKALGDQNAIRDSLTRAVEANAMSAKQALIDLGSTPEDASRIILERQGEMAAFESGV